MSMRYVDQVVILSGLLGVTFHYSRLMILTSRISCLAKGNHLLLPANEASY